MLRYRIAPLFQIFACFSIRLKTFPSFRSSVLSPKAMDVLPPALLAGKRMVTPGRVESCSILYIPKKKPSRARKFPHLARFDCGFLSQSELHWCTSTPTIKCSIHDSRGVLRHSRHSSVGLPSPKRVGESKYPRRNMNSSYPYSSTCPILNRP